MAELGRDDKFFQCSGVEELRNDLHADRKGKNTSKKKATLKRIIANATMGNDMHALFPDVVECMDIPAIDIKKMVCTYPSHADLYLINYGRSNQSMLPLCIKGFLKDCNDPNPHIRALALRSMSYIPSPLMRDALRKPLANAIHDRDPNVRKTAAMAIAKVHMCDPAFVESSGYVEVLRDMLHDENVSVVSNAVAALYEVTERSKTVHLCISFQTAERLLAALGQCSEWGQTYILEMLLFFVPQKYHEAEVLAERVSICLQQTSPSVILTSVKVIMYLLNYIASAEFRELLCRRVSAALVTLLNSPSEIQYVALRNILLVIQRRPLVLHHDIKFFFCKYNDPIYLKLTKLEIICRLVHEGNALLVLPELKEYASEIDVDFARKAINTIGRLALRLDSTADRYVGVLADMVETGVNYIVQEVMIIAKDILRKYPNRFMNILKILCSHLDAAEEPQAKIAMIWILGQYSDRIENSVDLLEDFLYTFLEEPVEIQLALLTATVKLFLRRPSAGSTLVPKVLKWATQDVRNPDCRDRGYMYWRLLSSSAADAKKVVLAELPVIDTHFDRMDKQLLDQLLLQGNSLSSVYFRVPQSFIRGAKGRFLTDSPALELIAKQSASSHLYDHPTRSHTHAHTHQNVSLGSNVGIPVMGPMVSDLGPLETPNESLISDASTNTIDEDESSGSLINPMARLHLRATQVPPVGSLI